jgi:hypothetical protein
VYDLEETATDFPDEIAQVHRDCSLVVRRYCLETTHFVFQLEYVLTPSGRLEARNELCPWVTNPVECSPGMETHSDTSSSTASDIDDNEFEGPLEMF